MKTPPVNPNTLQATAQSDRFSTLSSRGSPLTKQNLMMSTGSASSLIAPHSPVPQSGGGGGPRRANKPSSSHNPDAAAVFGEELSNIVRIGDYDESGVPVTTVNLGLKSKRIVKHLTHPNSFNATGYGNLKNS